MAQRVTAFDYAVEAGDSLHTRIGTVIIAENQTSPTREGFPEIPPEYAFSVIDQEGKKVAEIAAGFWPFVKAVLSQAIAFHGEACVFDSAEVVEGLTIRRGNTKVSE